MAQDCWTLSPISWCALIEINTFCLHLAFKHSSQHGMHEMRMEKKSECTNIFSTLHMLSPKSPNEVNRKHHHHFQLGTGFQVDVYIIF